MIEKKTPAQVRELTKPEPEDLPLVPQFFDFAYSDEGMNDPLNIMLERETNDEMTIEIITVGTHKTIHFIYKD